MKIKRRRSWRDFVPVTALLFCIASIVYLIFGIATIESATAPEIDSTPPEIILNGESFIEITAGAGYEELGATASDDGAEITVEITGHVHANTPGRYLLLYTATDAAGNVAVKPRVVTVKSKTGGIIYLTFDDGPGPYTAELLDVLKKYNVKATFFVTGAGDDAMLTREYNEGHAIGLHTFSHNYSYIYASIDNFFEDLYKVQNRVRNATGYTSFLMRFPGGSSNTVSARYDGKTHIMTKLASEVENRGFTYFDWNVTSGDAGETTSTDQIVENVTSRLIKNGKSIVLQHDVKNFSVAAVERIIQYGLANGYTFATLDSTSFTAHHRINN